ncbi:Cof-type HAD-IIB family hydrolase [Weissella cibaria]|uniref:Cof-type HAD-IIB family hydrolase n=1 Tax=Weissella cibaria TaxID=137591 RepID=UPI001D04D423|nr:Cof-type HAD-IIB family hydrolase [Weissella cibaria]MCB5827425.1 Cof-type HAD-IIB family hydrolase [Weissella cibaria]MCB5859006.1 Cof-type HAD-IIB family hydrolase [Weissella cibaria]MCB5861208.1 Cof-type HAD-IIB family hydrolase [Weissella cibaria]MCB5863542.1 Cof-type HAD-IIB family hydrolase [Weissella cibaria]MCB5865725.1 Cof-type HAD-IIB family hydrolase [Weissella cibaria]
MVYKMLVSDLDETLLNDDGTVHADNLAAIKTAVAHGFKFVPNTGRSFNSVQALLKTLGLYDQAGQYVISYNGAAIVENKDNQVLLTLGMDRELAAQIFRAGLVNDQVDVHIYTVDTLFIYNISPTDKQYMAERGVPYELMASDDLAFLANEQPVMKVIFEHPDQTVREQIRDAVLAAVGADAVEATFSSSRYVEFNTKGVDKGSASLLLGEKLGIQRDEIIAAGDNNNDLKMLTAVGLGVSVANGIPAVQEAAAVVTERTNNEGAIAEILEKYVLKDFK